MNADHYYEEISRLQQLLSQAKETGRTDAEIDAFLSVGKVAYKEDPQLAYHHFRLAEKVIRGTKDLTRLHEAIGGQGIAFRHENRIEEAIERYQAAERAAQRVDNEVAQASWILQRVSAERARDNLQEAKDLVQQAEHLLRTQQEEGASFLQFMSPIHWSNKEEVAVLAELDGQIGINLISENDQQESEEYYRSALHFAELAEDWSAINTWAANVGNAQLRRGKYSEAMQYYEKALDAAQRRVTRSGVVHAAQCMANCMKNAYRHEEGGDRIRAIAETDVDDHSKARILNEALELYYDGCIAKKALKTVKDIESLIANKSIKPEYRDRIQLVKENMEMLDSVHAPKDDAPPLLDSYLANRMAWAEESKQVEVALQAAYLVCDTRLALMYAGENEWQRLYGGDIHKHHGIGMRVILDTVRMLMNEERNEDVLELLQRYKASTYCIPTLQHLRNLHNQSPEVKDYLDAVEDLREQVNNVAGLAKMDSMLGINAFRRAGERLREAGEVIRDIDSVLLARLGGPVRSEDLIDAFPFGNGVGIVDFMVGPNDTLGLILARGENGVFMLPFITPSFNASHTEKLWKLYIEGYLPKQLGGKQTESLMEISEILHDNFCCKLAQALAERIINQIIFIPDILTRNIPLHLSRVCGKEFHIPNIDTQDAQFLCEVMPVEYAPCLQAVAASQIYIRPRVINKIVAFVDPNGDLPGARVSVKEFKNKIDNPKIFDIKEGKDVTKDAVVGALPDSDIAIFGTHGVFSPSNLEMTHLVLHDEPWTMADVIDMPDLQKRALLLLMACEAGAVSTTLNDRDAWGLPGALVSTGASAVMANLWPVEDITSNYLLERFLVHLSHPGYRPAAAFFRSVRDLRHMKKHEAIEYCRRYMEVLKENKAPARVLIGARNILEFVEDDDSEQPFAHPFFWGATAIFGSGWHLPAGGYIAPPDVLINNIERLDKADKLVSEWQPKKALELVTQLANETDGVMRGNAYTTMALALLLSADLSSKFRLRRKAIHYLKAAQRIATNEGDKNLQERIQWVYKYTEDENVVQKDD